MKRILSLALVLGMLFAAVACGNTETNETTDPVETTTEASTENTVPSVNEGEFKAGVYTATSSYASGEMNMVWNFILTLNEDGTFVLTNDALEEKGTGFVRAMWCGDEACEDRVKEITGVGSRCIPFEQVAISDKCVCCGKPADTMVLWGKAY